jgi:protein TonB
MGRTARSLGGVVVALVAALAAFAQPAPAPLPPPQPLAFQDLKWSRLPSGDDVARVYPDRAARKGVMGGALVVCRIGADRRLEACEVAGEAPANYGFGAAAVELGRMFKLKRVQPDPRATPGAAVEVRITFVLPGRRW